MTFFQILIVIIIIASVVAFKFGFVPKTDAFNERIIKKFLQRLESKGCSLQGSFDLEVKVLMDDLKISKDKLTVIVSQIATGEQEPLFKDIKKYCMEKRIKTFVKKVLESTSLPSCQVVLKTLEDDIKKIETEFDLSGETGTVAGTTSLFDDKTRGVRFMNLVSKVVTTDEANKFNNFRKNCVKLRVDPFFKKVESASCSDLQSILKENGDIQKEFDDGTDYRVFGTSFISNKDRDKVVKFSQNCMDDIVKFIANTGKTCSLSYAQLNDAFEIYDPSKNPERALQGKMDKAPASVKTKLKECYPLATIVEFGVNKLSPLTDCKQIFGLQRSPEFALLSAMGGAYGRRTLDSGLKSNDKVKAEVQRIRSLNCNFRELRNQQIAAERA